MTKESATPAAEEAVASEPDAASIEEQPESASPPDEAPAGASSAEPPPDPEALAAALDEARAALAATDAAHDEEVLRLKAEMENLRRRSAREVENAHKYGVERLVNELLPVKDSMELGLAAAAEEGAGVDGVREGLDLTLKMFVTALEKFGLEEVDPGGQLFDPDFHQAMSIQPTAEAAPDTVLTVFQKGYVLSGRLVRPAMVVVAKAPDGA